MKKQFFDYMHEIMDTNPDVYFILCGLGYPRVDEFLEKYPTRAFNTEAAEQTSQDMAVGLAYAGKIPVVYSITPFLLYRPFETWRTYINHEQLHVIGVGVGRGDDYSKHDGFSHDASDDKKLFGIGAILTNVTAAYPETDIAMRNMLEIAVESDAPYYINIKR